MPDFLLSLVIAGIPLGLVFSLQQIVARKRNQNSFNAFFLFLNTSVILWGIYVTSTDIAITHSRSTFLYVPALFAIGPLYYLYYITLLKQKRTSVRRLFVHLAIAAIAILIDLGLLIAPGSIRNEVLSTLYQEPLNHILTPVIILGCLHMLGYFIFLLVQIIKLYNRLFEVRLFIRIGVLANVMAFTALTCIGVGFLFKLRELYLAGGALISLIHGALLLMSVRFPYFFQILASELKKQGYEKSLLENLDTNRLSGKLEEYMVREEPYLEDRLSIRQVAQALAISSGQLSQLLNDKLEIDFRNYVNRHRVNKAKEMLAEDAESNVLSICYQVGFNSKSAFYTAFKRFTGQTPSDYKNKIHRAKGQ